MRPGGRKTPRQRKTLCPGRANKILVEYTTIVGFGVTIQAEVFYRRVLLSSTVCCRIANQVEVYYHRVLLNIHPRHPSPPYAAGYPPKPRYTTTVRLLPCIHSERDISPYRAVEYPSRAWYSTNMFRGVSNQVEVYHRGTRRVSIHVEVKHHRILSCILPSEGLPPPCVPSRPMCTTTACCRVSIQVQVYHNRLLPCCIHSD